MKLTRTIKKGVVGSDARYVKDALYSLGYLTKAPTHSLIGSDSDRAIRAFQRDNKDMYGRQLEVDGKVGPLTFAVLQHLLIDSTLLDVLQPTDYKNISKATLETINKDLLNVTDIRVSMVAHLLQFAYDDKGIKRDPSSLYIYGANLFDEKLQLHIATEAYIRKRAKARPEYFTKGRMEWMIEKANTGEIACGDCSGAIVGALRIEGLVKPSFDVTANRFLSNQYSKDIRKAELRPADFVGRSGHIGLYAGGGKVIEFVGGAYTCQITELDSRKARNFITGTLDTMSGWTSCRSPKFYS